MTKIISENHIYDSFKSLINEQDEVIILYSAIFSFAHKLPWNTNDSAKNILNIIIDIVGKERTLVIPSYFHDFAKNRTYDLRRSPTSNGLISMAALTNPKMNRTHNPIQSYLVYGRFTNEILNINSKTMWGRDSIMNWLYKKNAKIINLGLPWHKACSLLHYSEEIRKVPYRYFKRFKGKFFINGKFISECEEVMYCKSLEFTPIWQYENIYTELLINDLIIKDLDNILPIEASYANNYINITNQMLQENPYAYVKNVIAVKNWVNKFKEVEIKNLGRDEKYEE